MRALHDDGSRKPQDTPRDFVLALDEKRAPLLSVYGGKITTYRRLAEAALAQLSPMLGDRPPWTARSRLPGGDFPGDGLERLLAATMASWPFLDARHARRLVRAYGTCAAEILGSARTPDDLGPPLGADLTGAEVRYLMAREWAQTADDVLWRRGKLGLVVSREERERLAKFMTDAVGSAQEITGASQRNR